MRLVIEHGHLPKNIPGHNLGKDPPAARTDEGRDLNHPVLDDKDAVPLVALPEDLLPGGIGSFSRERAQGVHFGPAELARDPARFEHYHKGAAYTDCPGVASAKLG
jgi:hypothetical protein